MAGKADGQTDRYSELVRCMQAAITGSDYRPITGRD